MNNFLRLLLLAAAVLTLTGCSKATNVQFDTLVNNLSRDFPALWRLSTGFAYLMGVGFMMRGIYKMKQYGDMSTMMSASRSLKEPVTLLVVGAALMFFPTTKAILLTSTFGYGSQVAIPPYDQTIGGINVVPGMLMLVQLVGLVSFIRGWIQLTHSQSGGQNSFGKAMTHIIGGLLAINIQGTVDMLQASFLR